MMVFFEVCTLTFEVGKDTKGYIKKRNGRAIALPLSPNNHRLTTIIFLQSLPKI